MTDAIELAADDAVKHTDAELDYLFDLHGYRIIRNALSAEQLAAINAWVDAQDVDALEPGDWIGDVEVQTYGSKDGTNFQNIIEAGPVFEELIDNPAWLEQVRRYIVVDDHMLRIDECFLNVRRSGGYIGIHSGGHNRRFSGLFRWHTGQWAVGQINVLMALHDVGPGDGCTTIVPGSHKCHEVHPFMRDGDVFHKHGGDALAMREVHLKAGDALMFADGLTHGSMARTSPGERRVMIYRYAPHLLAPRMNYIPSEALVQRLTPERRRIVMPVAPRLRPGRTLSADAFSHAAVGR
ncbi:MAG: phytanoyl-CoA dioxygenase family protein [Phycisphaeraceae bacterium]